MKSIIVKDVRTITCAPDGANLVVVCLDTNIAGLTGYGCATFTQRWHAVVNVIDNYMKPLLLGREVNRIEDLWQLTYGSSYWRNGPVLNNALSGCDMALWDILGKLAGQPVYNLLGGKCREAVPVYTHADGRDLAEVEDAVNFLIDQGYKYIRCQMGGYGGRGRNLNSPENCQPGAYYDDRAYARNTVKLFAYLREKLGFEIELLHDVHERLSPAEAVRLSCELDPYRLFFLEDILPPEHIHWFRQIRHKSTTPLAMGELFNNPNEWMPLIEGRLIDYIRVHISQIGGLTPARKLAILCEAFGIRTAWHGPGDVSPIGHACNLHLGLSSSNLGIQEWCGIDLSENLAEVFTGIPQVRDGYAYVNNKPGLGIEVNEKAALRYPCSNDLPDWTIARLPDGTAVRP